MKIVLAEKVSPATLAVFESEPGWQIVTHDQVKNGLAAEICRCRRSGRPLGGAGR